MKKQENPNLGIMFRREYPPEALPDFARRAEEIGFDELWVVEDCFYGSGIASAATALACTESIKVGLGIMPAVARNPVFTAMEIATLARLYPDRFLPGIGHGMAGWMRQIGAFPKSQLKALGDVAVTVQKLLRGERFTFDGQQVKLDDVALVHPPKKIPPISLGVRGPKSLELSGRVADGTILAEFTAPAYVSWARAQIAKGQQLTERNQHHRITVLSFACADTPTLSARRQMRPVIAKAIASGGIDAQISPMGILPRIKELLAQDRGAQLESMLPDEWIDQLSIAGSANDWRLAIRRLVDAGANTVVLVPLADKGLDEIEVFARHFMTGEING